MDKNKVERILLIATLAQNTLPYAWTIFLALFYIYKKSFNVDVSFSGLYVSTALLRIATFFARNIKSYIHSVLGLKRTIQLAGLLYLLNFFSFYKFSGWVLFYVNSIWLGLLNGILTSTIVTYLREKQELAKVKADFYAILAYYVSFIFSILMSLIVFNWENRPVLNANYEGFDNEKNKDNFRTMMDILGITAVVIIEACTAFLEDPMKYNPAFQEWLNAKLNEERERGDNKSMTYTVQNKHVIGHFDDQSISNVHNNRMDNRISGLTLFTTKKEFELVLNQQADFSFKNRETKTEKIYYEEELALSVSFLNNKKEDSENFENYDFMIQNTLHGQNFFLIFAVNAGRLITLNLIGFSSCIIGLSVQDNFFAVLIILFIGLIFKFVGGMMADHLPKFINIHKIYMINLILNILLALIALNMHERLTYFFIIVCGQKLLEGLVYALQGSVGNYLYEFEKKEVASALFELESVASVVAGSVFILIFANGLNFISLYKALIGLDVIVLVLFFYSVSTKF